VAWSVIRSQVLVQGLAADAELAGKGGFLFAGSGSVAQIGHLLGR
jgi:hypothetical protein